MATVSPTPFAASAFPTSRSSQHASSRTTSRSYASRPALRRHSPISVLEHGHGFSADAPVLQDITYGDSSDDDIPPPMNFSALTKALLEDRPTSRGRPSPHQLPSRTRPASPNHARRPGSSRAGTPSAGDMRVIRKSPAPDAPEERVSPPRVVHLSGSRGSSAKKTFSERVAHSIEGQSSAPNELVTPAPMPRKRPTYSRVNSAYSTGPSSNSNSSANRSMHSTDYQSTSYVSTRATSVEVDASNVQEEEAARVKTGEMVPGSVRVKRGGLVSGTLRGAPMRRPFRRRASDEGADEQSLAAEPMSASRVGLDEPEVDSRGDEHEEIVQKKQEHIEVQDFASPQVGAEQGRAPASSASRASGHVRTDSRQHPAVLRDSVDKPPAQPRQEKPAFKMPVPPPLPSMEDQENEPPPTFKRNKPQVVSILGDKLSTVRETPVASGQTRQPLAARSINTPQRAAPPPPKMSVLETATATAGASTVKSKKKRTHVTLNGKVYSLRGRLGKGGSSDVYRVMAENDKMFALKKVNLDDANEDTIRGYKGEIDLLKKLENVERVVRLFDWEVNEQKQCLSVLMEIGESDLNRILSTRIHPDDAKLDLSFTRHYWREMLECVSAVHACDVVHSDLKPANFLLVQGHLKLIDFGIANAIDTDNTVNVHRETNVGTPNYMSPESLVDTNADQRAAAGPGGAADIGKLMKVGKPSDVWSLGCILYQMTYGRPPFAHITNQWNRIMSIINPNVHISYPDTGIGGVTIPSSLKRLLRSCLNRDYTQRLTVDQLLSEKEPFLNPDLQTDKWEAQGAVPMTENVLEQILMKIVERCRDPKRGIPTDEELKVYPKAFLDRVRGLQRA